MIKGNNWLVIYSTLCPNTLLNNDKKFLAVTNFLIKIPEYQNYNFSDIT